VSSREGKDWKRSPEKGKAGRQRNFRKKKKERFGGKEKARRIRESGEICDRRKKTLEIAKKVHPLYRRGKGLHQAGMTRATRGGKYDDGGGKKNENSINRRKDPSTVEGKKLHLKKKKGEGALTVKVDMKAN